MKSMKTNRSIYLAGVLALSLIPAAAAQTLKASHASAAKVASAPKTPSAVVARVNGVPVTQEALERETRRIFPSYSMHGGVPAEYASDIRKKALNNLIEQELAYQEALRQNLPIPAAEWNARLRDFRADYKSDAEFEAAIKKLFSTRAAFEKQLRHDMLLDRIWLLEVKNKSAVSDADVQLYYQRNRAQFVQPESVAFQTISTLYPAGATPTQKQAARKRAETVLPRAKAARNYEEFGVVAEKFSEDPWRVMMGDRKFLHRSAAPPEFLPAFSMKPGETSGILESPEGYVILRVNQHVPQKQMSFAEVQTSIRAALEKERLAKRTKSFHEMLRKAAKVEVL